MITLNTGAIYLILHKEKIPGAQRERIMKEIIHAHGGDKKIDRSDR